MSKEAMKLALARLQARTDTADLDAIAALNEALAEQPVQQEPVALKWQQAPVKTQWGDDMVVASVAIDNDHTLSLYCERDQAPRVEAMFAQRKPLTQQQKSDIYNKCQGLDVMKAITLTEAAIKENT